MKELSRLTTAFGEKGFLLDNSGIKENITYRGNIETERFGAVEIFFVFNDDSLTRFPNAYIGNSFHDKFPPYHFPHLNSCWELCYHDNSRIFDKYIPDFMVNYCIQQVVDVINKGRIDDMSEIIPEFQRYWDDSGRNPYYGWLIPSDDTGYQQGQWIISQTVKFRIDSTQDAEISIFKIRDIPSIQNINWPIEDYASFKDWLGTEYSDVENEIQKLKLFCVKNRKRRVKFLICIESKNIYIGMEIEFLSPIYNAKVRKFHSDTVQAIINGDHKITRFVVDNYSSEKLILSNFPKDTSNLIDKKILLVGAGTIGSNLANILVRNGAGCGEDGILTIVDPDRFEPHNISRHFLGIKFAGQNKAIALKAILESNAPYSNIDAINGPVQKIDLKQYEIIIDPTGEESVTIWLNEKLKSMSKKILFISAWVCNPVNSVESFSMINTQGACHECYRKSPLYKPASSETLPLRDSCNSVFLPFPITASLYASLLVIYVLNKWLSKPEQSSLFCHQNIDPIKEIEEHYLIENPECMLCGKNYIME